MLRIGSQYYRPPFPVSSYWDHDFAAMKESGLNTVQLWVTWGWVEAKENEFRFEDYDEIVKLADEAGLQVVLSTIVAVQPYWIHRQVPDSEMIDNMGNKVISSNREECHFGLTPGGCLDHPGVWDRVSRFLSAVVGQYKSAHNLYGWDAWNELRWNVHADGFVCYCPHTIGKFRKWLDEEYGGLDGLNRSWQRRYDSWEDVMPGKVARSPYTEMMAFVHFLTCRANEHAVARYEVIKSLDPKHPVTVHGGVPCVLHAGQYPVDSPLDRGNDWAFADRLDGIGTTSFPCWTGMDIAEFSARIGFTASAARGKLIWLSEIQGGRASTGFDVHTPVPASDQQRWLWSGVVHGAEVILFWCWRDEVFGRESGGFGLTGLDGYGEQRLAAMKKTSELLAENEKLLDAYRPDGAEVGIFFSPQSYYLHWNEEQHAHNLWMAMQGYARGLQRNNIPYLVVEEEHLDQLEGLKILFMPRAIVIDDHTAERLCEFVRNGGMIVCESECGAFASNGIYRYPNDRFLAELSGGISEIGRRALTEKFITLNLDGQELKLPAKQWLTPIAGTSGKSLGQTADGSLATESPAGKGHIVMCAGYFGDAYYVGSVKKQADYAPYVGDFERFLDMLVARASVRKPVEVIEPAAPRKNNVVIQSGRSSGKPVAFVIYEESQPIRLRFACGTFSGPVRDIVSGQEIALSETADGQECELPNSQWGVAVLTQLGSVE